MLQKLTTFAALAVALSFSLATVAMGAEKAAVKDQKPAAKNPPSDSPFAGLKELIAK